MTLVRKLDGAWVAARGVLELAKLVDTREVHYADGRVEQETCEPYPVPFVIDTAKVAAFVAEGTWSAEDLAEYGMIQAQPFEAPAGKQITGEPRYVEAKDAVSEVYDVEDIPPPTDRTPAEKLAAAGLTVEDLRALLAGGE